MFYLCIVLSYIYVMYYVLYYAIYIYIYSIYIVLHYMCTVVLCCSGSKGQPESKCPELLANYCDMLLRKTPLSKKLTAEEVEKRLKDLVRRCIHPLRLTARRLTTQRPYLNWDHVGELTRPVHRNPFFIDTPVECYP